MVIMKGAESGKNVLAKIHPRCYGRYKRPRWIVSTKKQRTLENIFLINRRNRNQITLEIQVNLNLMLHNSKLLSWLKTNLTWSYSMAITVFFQEQDLYSGMWNVLVVIYSGTKRWLAVSSHVKRWLFFLFIWIKETLWDQTPGKKVKVTSNYFKVIKPRINISRLAHLIQSGTKQFHSFLLTTWKKYLNWNFESLNLCELNRGKHTVTSGAEGDEYFSKQQI